MSDEKFSLDQLFANIKNKIANQEANSYSSDLAKAGLEKITRKIGEEALEVVIASFINQKENSQKTRAELIGEICDLFYHSLVLMAAEKIEFEEILKELQNRSKK